MEDNGSLVTRDSGSSDDGHYLIERAGLRADIAELIKGHRRRRAEPPFSAADLIVMAVVSSDEEQVSRLDILRWIIHSFTYYKELAIESYLQFNGYRYANIYGSVPEFDKAFDAFDLPLVVVEEEDDVDDYDMDEIGEGTGRYSVDTRAARVHLRCWLEPTRKGTFRFLDLPGEIRNTIYEMTLQYPSSGLRIPASMLYRSNIGEEPVYKPIRLQVMDRAHDIRDPVAGGREAFTLPPLHSILSMTLLCKQVYQEAAKTFYQINTFCLGYIDALAGLSLQMNAKFLHNLGGLRIMQGCPCNMAFWLPAVEALANKTSCKILSVDLNDESWLGMTKRDRKQLGRVTKFTKISQVPGFKQLAIAASKAETFELVGDCPLIKAFVDEEVAKIKSGVGKLSKPRTKRAKTSKTSPVSSKKKTTASGQT